MTTRSGFTNLGRTTGSFPSPRQRRIAWFGFITMPYHVIDTVYFLENPFLDSVRTAKAQSRVGSTKCG